MTLTSDDLLEMLRARIARCPSERELHRLEQSVAAIHTKDVGLLTQLAPDISRRRRQLRQAMGGAT